MYKFKSPLRVKCFWERKKKRLILIFNKLETCQLSQVTKCTSLIPPQFSPVTCVCYNKGADRHRQKPPYLSDTTSVFTCNVCVLQQACRQTQTETLPLPLWWPAGCAQSWVCAESPAAPGRCWATHGRNPQCCRWTGTWSWPAQQTLTDETHGSTST